MPVTEIAYVCGANYWRYLFLSLRTLLSSGSTFDRVAIYVVGDGLPRWPLADSRIVVKRVPDIGGGYWYLNKTHVCDSDADRVVFVDTDVMILGPIEETYGWSKADLIARPEPWTYDPRYNAKAWDQALHRVGAARYPALTCGFFVLQNGAQHKLRDAWRETTRQILAGELGLERTRFAEQQAFSIAASRMKLSYDLMEPRHHRYAMIGETDRDAVVYHLGTPNFYRHYIPVEMRIGLKSRRLAVPRPSCLPLRHLVSRMRYRIRRCLSGPRDLAVDQTY